MLPPETRAVPETTTVASGSKATAFTEANEVRAGNTSAPSATGVKPFTVKERNAVLEDLATTTVTVYNANVWFSAVTRTVIVFVPVRKLVFPNTSLLATALVGIAITSMLCVPLAKATGDPVYWEPPTDKLLSDLSVERTSTRTVTL